MGGARDPRVGGGLVGDGVDGRRPDRPDRRRARRLDGDAPERGRGRGGRTLLLPSDRSRPQPRRLRAGSFPSVRYLYQAQPDLDVVICESDEEIVERIDERTLLVPISHVLYKAGQIQDVEAIVRRAHEMGAHVILDCYQSAGIVPLDVTALDVDFAVGGSVSGSAEALGTAGCTCARTSPSSSSRPSPAGRRTRARSRSRRRWSTRQARCGS